MERKIAIVALSLFFTLLNIKAQGVSNCDYYEAFFTQKIELFKDLNIKAEKQYLSNPTNENLYLLIVGRYGYIAHLLGKEKKDEALAEIIKLETEIDKLLANNYKKGELYTIKSSTSAFRISINYASAFTYYKKVNRYLDTALVYGKVNPYYYWEKGNVNYYSPEFLEGSYEDAAKNYGRAIDYAKLLGDTTCNWRYLNFYLWKAKAYENLGENEKAISVYKELLKIEPGFIAVNRWMNKIN